MLWLSSVASGMKLLTPTQHKRLNEITGLILLCLGLLMWLSMVSYQPQDPSWNTAVGSAHPVNLIGYVGSYMADLFLQTFGLAAFFFPIVLFLLAWKWVRSEPVEAPLAKMIGSLLFVLSAGVIFPVVLPNWRVFSGNIQPGGIAGFLLADYLVSLLNMTGTILLDLTVIVVSIYLMSTFAMAQLGPWFARPVRIFRGIEARWNAWLDARRRRKLEREEAKQDAEPKQERVTRPRPRPQPDSPPISTSAYEEEPAAATAGTVVDEIPICQLEDAAPWESTPVSAPAPVAPAKSTHFPPQSKDAPRASDPHPAFRLPPTMLLNEPPVRSAFDEQELKDIAVRVKAKFEEFNVLGSVVQINPGPVVTTFEYKPDAGIKYSRITNLSEDLCLGLQAESILIERIPGKPTVGIEVPNSKRDVISLRQILESEEFL
ncbi:MAG: DNA translocase FtsK 4TM domain-containing protein, partial [Bryobacteraceae bacterium]